MEVRFTISLSSFYREQALDGEGDWDQMSHLAADLHISVAGGRILGLVGDYGEGIEDDPQPSMARDVPDMHIYPIHKHTLFHPIQSSFVDRLT